MHRCVWDSRRRSTTAFSFQCSDPWSTACFWHFSRLNTLVKPAIFWKCSAEFFSDHVSGSLGNMTSHKLTDFCAKKRINHCTVGRHYFWAVITIWWLINNRCVFTEQKQLICIFHVTNETVLHTSIRQRRFYHHKLLWSQFIKQYLFWTFPFSNLIDETWHFLLLGSFTQHYFMAPKTDTHKIVNWFLLCSC